MERMSSLYIAFVANWSTTIKLATIIEHSDCEPRLIAMSLVHAIYLLAASNSLPSFEFVSAPFSWDPEFVAEKFPRTKGSIDLIRASLKEKMPGFVVPSGFDRAIISSRSSQGVSGGSVVIGSNLYTASTGNYENVLLKRGHMMGAELKPCVWVNLPTETQPSEPRLLNIPSTSNRGVVLDVQNGKAVGIVGTLVTLASGTPVTTSMIQNGAILAHRNATGAVRSLDSEVKPVIWDITTKNPTMLNSLPGFSQIYASGINAQGEIVGYGSGTSKTSRRGIIWVNGSAQDLNNLVTGIPANHTIEKAISINDAGDVLALVDSGGPSSVCNFTLLKRKP